MTAAPDIQIFTEDISYSLPYPLITKNWLMQVAAQEGYEIDSINIIFCSDEYLHGINLKYLNHDNYTDIITFDNSEEINKIEADLFISIERVRENADTYHCDWELELNRVMVHGLLHLMGYNDKNEYEVQEIRQKEDTYLKLLAEAS